MAFSISSILKTAKMDSRGIYGGIRGMLHDGIDKDKEQKAGTYFPDWHRVTVCYGISGAIWV